jgi:hypothetical protein
MAAAPPGDRPAPSRIKIIIYIFRKRYIKGLGFKTGSTSSAVLSTGGKMTIYLLNI